jgi:hypothetical protein
MSVVRFNGDRSIAMINSNAKPRHAFIDESAEIQKGIEIVIQVKRGYAVAKVVERNGKLYAVCQGFRFSLKSLAVLGCLIPLHSNETELGENYANERMVVNG